MTLRELYDRHPEWRDLPMVVYAQRGYEVVGDSARVYFDDDAYVGNESDPNPVIVFTAN